jgi:hypothetical protein
VDIFLAFPGFQSGKALFFMGKKGKRVSDPLLFGQSLRRKNIYFMVKWLAY